MAMARVLVVEGEEKLRRGLADGGYDMVGVGDGEEGPNRALDEPFDCVILDVMLPGLDGMRPLGELRAAIDDGRAVAAQFLDQVRAGQLEAAWQGCSTEFKSLTGVENLRDYVKAHPAPKAPAEFGEARAVDRKGRSMEEYVFRGTAKVRGKTAPATIRVPLAHGDAGWQAEHLSVE